MNNCLKVYRALACVVFLFLFLPLTSAALTDGLMEYWSMDQSSGTNVINNISGGTNGTATADNPVWSMGKLGNGLNFTDQTTKYVDITGVTSTTKSYTFCFWIWDYGGSAPNDYIIDSQTGRITIHVTDSEELRVSGIGATGVFDILASDWNYVCVVLDSSVSNARAYINGTQSGSNMTYDDRDIGGVVVIANRYSKTSGNPNMILDEVGIWNRTLTDLEISELYNSGNGLAYPFAPADTCTCPGAGNDWEIDMSDYCNITDACDLTTGTLSFTGAGITRINAIIKTTNLGDPGASGILKILSDCLIWVKGT